MMRRARALFVALICVVAIAAVPSATAQTYPIVEEPVLRPDSAFEATDYGYKLKELVFPETIHPTVFTMEGYSGASRPAPNVYLRMDDGELMALRITFGAGPRGDYAFVQASTRGTECSGGSFNLYDRRHAWDGYHIIEWIADQDWSNGNVGMFGSSFPGQTAYFVATTQPPALKAISANLLHSDIYRDIFMPGGVQNYLFPTLWTYAAGPHRLPQDSVQNETIPADEICSQLQASRYSVGDLPQAQNEPAWAALRSVDDDWYAAHAALTYAPSIKIPYYQQTNWQDEQVGPRAVVLFDHINPDPQWIRDSRGKKRFVVPKKFVAANGDHGHGGFAGDDRWSWFDIWLLGMPDVNGLLDHQVTNYFEADGEGVSIATKSGNSWPFEDTKYEKSYLHEGGVLNEEPPTTAEAPDTYLSGAARQNWFQYAPDNFGSEVTTARGLPDQVTYVSEPMTEAQAIAGPILMNLAASIAGTDADFYVSISDLFPDGSVSFLQRGLLKASHRRVDPERSYYAADGQTMVQPYRPHTNPQPVTPDEIINYKVEI
ncbi:MAG: CocE/NonD family hydrolase, partial [Actinomycetota bacterium]